jgi:hypothetical protein
MARPTGLWQQLEEQVAAKVQSLGLGLAGVDIQSVTGYNLQGPYPRAVVAFAEARKQSYQVIYGIVREDTIVSFDITVICKAAGAPDVGRSGPAGAYRLLEEIRNGMSSFTPTLQNVQATFPVVWNFDVPEIVRDQTTYAMTSGYEIEIVLSFPC